MFLILLGDEFWQISHGWLQDPTQPHQHQNQGQYDPKNIHVQDIKYKFHNFCECLRVRNTRSQPHALKKEAKQTTNIKMLLTPLRLEFGTSVIDLPERSTAGLKIISRESPDSMTGQILFSSVTYRFWPVKFRSSFRSNFRNTQQLRATY